MGGNRTGGLKAAATNRERHGRDFYTELGRKGGKASRGGGFAKSRELASIAGRKGGSVSSRKGVRNGESKHDRN